MTFRALILLSAVLVSGCSNKLFESNWRSPEKEHSNFRFYDAESKIRYNIENDSTNLYFSFDVMDQLTIQKILTTGLRVFVDGTAKNKQKNEVQFPIYADKVPVSELQEYGTQYDQSMQLGKQTLDEMIPADGYLKLGSETSSIFNHMESKGVRVDLEFDNSRSLVYRVKIPLKYFQSESDIVSVGIETGGYELPQQDVATPNTSVVDPNQLTAGDRAMGRGQDPYGLNTPGGSTAAGMAMRNSTTYNKFADPIRFWAKVKLETKDQ
ncbi:MAG: hypothetical protein H6603_05665 [Flavobacteriales bacterium]|nr:hypothetical protein [Flavobacteriales bacterium]MCB9191633.1 hypothetical protein [Flavobacteriales bacterium]MCB9204447.1 hypothetical protein [Flavobacteriales bacterium]